MSTQAHPISALNRRERQGVFVREGKAWERQVGLRCLPYTEHNASSNRCQLVWYYSTNKVWNPSQCIMYLSHHKGPMSGTLLKDKVSCMLLCCWWGHCERNGGASMHGLILAVVVVVMDAN